VQLYQQLYLVLQVFGAAARVRFYLLFQPADHSRQFQRGQTVAVFLKQAFVLLYKLVRLVELPQPKGEHPVAEAVAQAPLGVVDRDKVVLILLELFEPRLGLVLLLLLP
jgi:hypothetical protein